MWQKKVQNQQKGAKTIENPIKRKKPRLWKTSKTIEKRPKELFQKKWMEYVPSELIVDCGWEYSFLLDVLASKRVELSGSDFSKRFMIGGSYFKGFVNVEFVLVHLVVAALLNSKYYEIRPWRTSI